MQELTERESLGVGHETYQLPAFEELIYNFEKIPSAFQKLNI